MRSVTKKWLLTGMLAGFGLLLAPVDLFKRRRMPVPNRRMDERDTMFARAARREKTWQYQDYYTRNPWLRSIDDRIRNRPRLCTPGGKHYHPEISKEADRWFERIGDITTDRDQVAAWADQIRFSRKPTRTLKKMLRAFGAVASGATRLDPAFVYTFKGRLDEDYGHEVDLPHPNALIFLVEMNHDAMQTAPHAEVIRESAKQYYRAARISMFTAAVLEELGYDAKPHYDGHYDVILPPLAVSAGLGELARNNILVADRYGSRVRIGAVTTDFPLKQDKPVHLAVQEFCEICKKCSKNCPSHSLTSGEKHRVRGVSKWPTKVASCYAYWRHIGTDCGICMAVCPYSHRTNRFHNSVRFAIRLNPWVRRLALWCDDLIYGKTWDGRHA